jgi:hypothetical protein
MLTGIISRWDVLDAMFFNVLCNCSLEMRLIAFSRCFCRILLGELLRTFVFYVPCKLFSCCMQLTSTRSFAWPQRYSKNAVVSFLTKGQSC